jgi:hypothetical protein
MRPYTDTRLETDAETFRRSCSEVFAFLGDRGFAAPRFGGSNQAPSAQWRHDDGTTIRVILDVVRGTHEWEILGRVFESSQGAWIPGGALDADGLVRTLEYAAAGLREALDEGQVS